jgi:hypothetical protein
MIVEPLFVGQDYGECMFAAMYCRVCSADSPDRECAARGGGNDNSVSEKQFTAGM